MNKKFVFFCKRNAVPVTFVLLVKRIKLVEDPLLTQYVLLNVAGPQEIV